MREGLYDSLLTARLRAQLDALTNTAAQTHDLADPDAPARLARSSCSGTSSSTKPPTCSNRRPGCRA